jgi:hypothetical protein
VLDYREERIVKKYIFLIDRQPTILKGMDKLSNHKHILLLAIIVILSILIYKIYKTYNTRGKEGFTVISGVATDLLTKVKSYEAQTQATNDTNLADLELSIYPWTTKLYNLQLQNQVKAIGLYKPHTVIKGIQYAKLGDMISLHSDYSPPDNKETTLLIAKIGSDIKAPIDYTNIVNTGNTVLPTYYYTLNNMISPNLAISSVVNNIQRCISALGNLNNLINKANAINTIKTTLNTRVNLQIGTSQSISLATLMTYPLNPSINGILNVGITSNTYITLPAGVNALFYGKDTRNAENTYSKLIDFKFGENLDLTGNITEKMVIDALTTDVPSLQGWREENVQLNKFQIGLGELFGKEDLLNYLKNLCNDIYTILSIPNISPELIRYLNLADSVDGVSSIISSLSTIVIPTDTSGNSSANPTNDAFLSAYATTNSRTFLGILLGMFINSPITLTYPSLIFKLKDLKFNDFSATSGVGTADIISNINNVVIGGVSSSIYESINPSLTNPNIVKNNTSIQNMSSITPNLNNILNFVNAISSNQVSYFSLQIYAPVPPSGYQSLGHVFCNVPKDLNKIKTMNNIACVPTGCVKEIRDWTAADKVFEFNKDGVYWALYKNPYIGTFIAVNQPGVPEGKVSKVVACVAKCTAVDELKKADQCARTYQSLNNSISSQLTTLPDLVSSTEEDIYLQQIKTQSDSIITLQNRARQLQTDIDKADIITTEMNKTKLQNYVDTQKRNIELVANRLEKDQNKIQANINIPSQVINQIITMINNLPNIPNEQKNALTNKIVSNAQAANSGLLNSAQYNTNLNNILRSCPQYDLSGLVKKSLVGDVCYGCGTPS